MFHVVEVRSFIDVIRWEIVVFGRHPGIINPLKTWQPEDGRHGHPHPSMAMSANKLLNQYFGGAI
jgi:hypothetical protein